MILNDITAAVYTPYILQLPHIVYQLFKAAKNRLTRKVIMENITAITKKLVITILYFIRLISCIYFDNPKIFNISSMKNIAVSPIDAPFISARLNDI